MRTDKDRTEIFEYTLRRVIFLMWLGMIAAAVFFLTGNFFFVEEGYVAMVSRFGRILGNDDYIIQPGGPHFAWPAPVDKVMKFPTTMQNLVLDDVFCSENDPGFFLIPGEDGALLTGDKNLVQGRWSMDYLVDAANLKNFALHTGSMPQAEILLKAVLERAIIHVVSGMTVDDFIKGNISNEQIKNLAQKQLDQLDSGLIIQHVTSKSYSVPPALQDVFMAVNRSESEKALQIEQAKRYREAKLNSVCGRDWQKAVAAADQYEKSGDDALLQGVFSSSAAMGQVAKILDEARIYRTAAVQEIKGEAERFQKLLQENRDNPEILRNRLLQDALQVIFAGKVKKFYLPENKDKTIYLDLNH